MSEIITAAEGGGRPCSACADDPVLEPSPDGRCRRCGRVWLYKTTADGVVVVHILPAKPIRYEDVAGLAGSFSAGHQAPRVVVNLSSLPIVASEFLSGLLTLRKKLSAAGGTLALCGARGAVREILAHTRLDTLFTLIE